MDVTAIIDVITSGVAAAALLGAAKLALQAGIKLWQRMSGAV